MKTQIKQSKKYLVVSKSGNTPSADEMIQSLVKYEPRLIAFFGKDCALLEDICDEYCVGDGQSPKEIITSSHPDEPIQDVSNFVANFEHQTIGKTFELVEI